MRIAPARIAPVRLAPLRSAPMQIASGQVGPGQIGPHHDAAAQVGVAQVGLHQERCWTAWPRRIFGAGHIAPCMRRAAVGMRLPQIGRPRTPSACPRADRRAACCSGSAWRRATSRRAGRRFRGRPRSRSARVRSAPNRVASRRSARARLVRCSSAPLRSASRQAHPAQVEAGEVGEFQDGTPPARRTREKRGVQRQDVAKFVGRNGPGFPAGQPDGRLGCQPEIHRYPVLAWDRRVQRQR